MKPISLPRTRIALLAAAVVCAPAWAAGEPSTGDKIDDAWIDGSVETALLFNRHLNNFEIDTDVKDGVVVLTGKVESEIDRELAGEVARGVDGVRRVDNRLRVGQPREGLAERAEAGVDRTVEAAERGTRSFRQWADDATTTAEIKSKLLANEHTAGLRIDIDTDSDVVTLRGTVKSAQESSLAEQIAQNTDGVDRVRNELKVSAR